MGFYSSLESLFLTEKVRLNLFLLCVFLCCLLTFILRHLSLPWDNAYVPCVPWNVEVLPEATPTLGNQQSLAHVRCTGNAGGGNLNRKVLLGPTLNDTVTDKTVAFPSLP